MRAITYSFWALIVTVALLTTAVIKLMSDDPTPPSDQVCYEPYGAPVEPEYILAGTVVSVKFVDPSDMPDGYAAYAIYQADLDTNWSVCHIVSMFPQQVLGDERMDALGHELLHCLTGAYHP